MALDKEEFSHPFGRTMNSSPAREKIETHPSKQLRHVLQYLTVMMRQVVALFQLSLCLSRACLGKLIFFVLNHGAFLKYRLKPCTTIFAIISSTYSVLKLSSTTSHHEIFQSAIGSSASCFVFLRKNV